jgi:ParB-like chromosome segregation protein Spo0J
MIQLRAEHQGIDINPKDEKWKKEIKRMLEGSYPGTERDQDAFQHLRASLVARKQLQPGVVLQDGGVLDGNRRLAVLLDLAEKEKTPSHFEYFDAVILPGDIGPEDRWRIEAGTQLGREEKWSYSPINQLLKIKEGLQIFKDSPNKVKEIAETLNGVSEKEVQHDITKIGLIDQYLAFIKKPKAYNEVGGIIERFEEVVNAIETSKKLQWTPQQVKKLKLTLWAVVRDQTMGHLQMRYIARAMGASGKGKRVSLKNEKALNNFLEIECSVDELQSALGDNTEKSALAEQHKEKANDFLEQMQALEVINKPLSLARRARTDLDTLLEALESGGFVSNKDLQEQINSLPEILQEVVGLASKCASRARTLHSKVKTTPAPQKKVKASKRSPSLKNTRPKSL